MEYISENQTVSIKIRSPILLILSKGNKILVPAFIIVIIRTNTILLEIDIVRYHTQHT